MKANVLVCGKIGAGKTSLIQAVTKFGVVPEENIGIGREGMTQLTVYETDAADFIDADGLDPGLAMADYERAVAEEKATDPGAEPSDTVIDAIWYCIDGSADGIDNADIAFIHTFSEKVLIVITKADAMTKEQTEKLLPGLREHFSADGITIVSARKQTGLKKLLDRTLRILETSLNKGGADFPEFQKTWNRYYEKKILLWKERAGAEADELINWAAGRAAAIAIVPLPLADVVPLVANEAYMIKKMAAIYGYTTGESVVTMLGGVAGGSIVGKALASFLPGLKIPIAAGVTYGVGKAAKAYFESDMKLDVSKLKDTFEKAKSEAANFDWKGNKEDDGGI